MNKFLHTCEVCGKQEMLTPEEAYNNGWDYPPYIGTFGIISPRVCGNCNMMNTVWWKITMDKVSEKELTTHDHEIIQMILDEKNLIEADNGKREEA